MNRWDWKKSRASSAGGACVEVKAEEQVFVRDTKDRMGGQLAVSGPDWASFIGAVKRGTLAAD